MRRGRRPKPSRLRLLNGNAGKRPINFNEPHPRALRNPAPPSWLDQYGREFWRRHAPELSRLGLLSVLDRDLLASAAERWSVYRRATNELKHSLIQTSEANGRIAKPESTIAKQALAECRAIMGEFGCSPSSRTRVTPIPVPPGDDDDPAAKYFRARHDVRKFLA
jgi:P27 family predicted phage terminase small subunit